MTLVLVPLFCLYQPPTAILWPKASLSSKREEPEQVQTVTLPTTSLQKLKARMINLIKVNNVNLKHQAYLYLST
jgi:hypothetical protein